VFVGHCTPVIGGDVLRVQSRPDLGDGRPIVNRGIVVAGVAANELGDLVAGEARSGEVLVGIRVRVAGGLRAPVRRPVEVGPKPSPGWKLPGPSTVPVVGGAGTLTTSPDPRTTGGFPVELIGGVPSIGKVSRSGPPGWIEVMSRPPRYGRRAIAAG
jgi:hypothetical protein